MKPHPNLRAVNFGVHRGPRGRTLPLFAFIAGFGAGLTLAGWIVGILKP